jgi:hypothetical protein
MLSCMALVHGRHMRVVTSAPPARFACLQRLVQHIPEATVWCSCQAWQLTPYTLLPPTCRQSAAAVSHVTDGAGRYVAERYRGR